MYISALGLILSTSKVHETNDAHKTLIQVRLSPLTIFGISKKTPSYFALLFDEVEAHLKDIEILYILKCSILDFHQQRLDLEILIQVGCQKQSKKCIDSIRSISRCCYILLETKGRTALGSFESS